MAASISRRRGCPLTLRPSSVCRRVESAGPSRDHASASPPARLVAARQPLLLRDAYCIEIGRTLCYATKATSTACAYDLPPWPPDSRTSAIFYARLPAWLRRVPELRRAAMTDEAILLARADARVSWMMASAWLATFSLPRGRLIDADSRALATADFVLPHRRHGPRPRVSARCQSRPRRLRAGTVCVTNTARARRREIDTSLLRGASGIYAEAPHDKLAEYFPFENEL